MVDRRKNQLAFDIPLPPSEERLLKRNLSPDPSGRNQPGLVVTRSGVPVWQVEQFRRSIGNPRQIAKEHGLKPSEVRAAILWAELYADDIDRRIEVNKPLSELIK